MRRGGRVKSAMKSIFPKIIILQLLFCATYCYAQYYEEQRLAEAQPGQEYINTAEKERILRNRIQSIEEWEYSFSFGEPNKTGSKLRIKKFDANGNKIYDWDLNESEVFLTYDINGRIVEETCKTGQYGKKDMTQKMIFLYNEMGYLMEKSKTNCMVNNESCKDIYEYDENGRKIKELNYIGGNLNSKYGYKYDNKGNCVEEITFNKDGSTNTGKSYKYVYLGPNTEKSSYYLDKFVMRNTWEYDSKGHMTEESVTTPPQYYNNKQFSPKIESTTAYKYNGNDQIIEKRSIYKYGTDVRDEKTIYSYDADGNLTQEKHFPKKDGKSLNTTYKYIGDNISEITKYDFNGNPNSLKKYIYTFRADNTLDH